jgi:GNAT superfamily N-acetyltransferase
MAELSIIPEIKKQYPFVELYAFEDDNQIYISSIKVPEEQRRKGIGRDIIHWIKDYAYEQQKPVVLSPEAERGYKKKLEKFYKNLGFVHNTGKKKDYKLARAFAPTMYWKPRLKFKEWLSEKY